jgi:DNA modification methylase
MLTLRGEKSALWKAWKRKDQTFYQCALECRAIGIHWRNIKQIIMARRKAGEDITIRQWAAQHAPVSVRWLNEYAEFAGRWNEFLETWRWSQSMPYSPERKAGLHTFQDLMLAKRRHDTISRSRQISFSGRGQRILSAGGNSVPMSASETSCLVEMLTPTNRLICGDVADMLRRHVPDATADVAIADPPFWLSRYYPTSGADRNYMLAGMTPRFDEPWDRFASLEDYERTSEHWLLEVMRCLKVTGSAFLLGTHHNIGLLNRVAQVKGYFIIAEVIWVCRNSRPNATTMNLQPTHFNILWLAKQRGTYRFNYRACKLRDYAGDYFSDRGKQLRDVWDIPHNPTENKRYGHPSPKPLALYERMLDVVGLPGGLLLDLFSGSGTGAVAAMRWGMESVSIEREPGYCDMIRRRVPDELIAVRR